MEDDPDEAAEPMSNGSDSLFVPHARDKASIHDLEDASLTLYRRVGTLIENAAHVAIALGGAVAAGDSRALFVSRA